MTAIGAVVGWKLATALNGTTGVGEGLGEGLAPAPDDEAIAFDAGVELATAVPGVANGVGVGMSCRVAGVLPGAAVAIAATAFGVELA